MSIKTYSTIAESYNINNYFDMYDDSYNKIRFSIKDQQLYITSYNSVNSTWSPATVIFDNSPVQTTSLVDFQDLILSNNIRIQLDANIPANGTELLSFEKINNYNYIKRSGLNYNINSSPYLPTTNQDDRLVIYELDSNGKPQFTLSPVSTKDFPSIFVTIANDQTITSVKTFNSGKLRLKGEGGNVTLNGSQTASSSSYTLEWPTAAPSGTLNVLTTSGSSPYSKYTWTNLSNYVLSSTFDQLSALNTTGSPSFANMTITSGGALNLNYMSAPASSDVLATINTNKQLTNSGTALSSLCTLGTAQTFTADKTFNYTAGKIKLSNYSTDNTSTNNFLTVNASGYLVPCNKLYSDMVDIGSIQTITGAKTLSGAATLSSSVTLSGVNSDTATSSGQKLTVLNTTTNAVERVNITPDTLVTTSSGTQTIAGNKTLSGTTTLSSSVTLSGVNSDTATSSGQKLTVLNTTTNAVQRVNITPDTLVTTSSGDQTIAGNKTLSGTTIISGAATLSSTVTLSGVNADTATSSGQKLTVLNTTTNAVQRINITPDTIITTTGAQTITGVKTYDYTTSKIALTNTTNDTTSTNKVLVLNASNQIIPCDKTYANIGAGGGGGSSVYNGYAALSSSVGNKRTSIIVANPLSSTSITVTANVSKTLDGDGNYVQFDNVLTTITSSYITFYISAVTEWIVDTTNTYTLFYSAMANPGTNPTYSAGTVAIPNLVTYYNFENGSGSVVDLVGGITVSGAITGTYTSASAKYGTYGFVQNNGANPSYYAGTKMTFCSWVKFNTNNPYLHTNLDGGNWNDLNVTATSLTSGVGTLKFTWAGATGPTVTYNGTVFSHLCITINNGGLTEVYWNGVQQISTNASGLNGTMTTRFVTYSYGNGEIYDDLRVYNRVLSASEIAAIANASSPSNILSSSYSSVIIPNVVSYWNFNSNVTDQVGTQAFTGTPTYNTSIFKYGTAAVNSTSTSLVTTLSSYTSNYGISLSFWLYNITNAPITINPAALTELNINTTGKTSTAIQIGISGGTLSTAQYSSALPYSASKWWHVVMIIDFSQKTLRLFYNGILAFIYTGTDSYFAAASWTAPVISLNKNGSANIDELRVYNRILTETEAGYLYTYNPTSINALAVPNATPISGYAAISSSSGNRQTTINVTNPFSTASVIVTANISKTTNTDGNIVLFDNVLPLITSSTITYNISANSDWVVDTNNIYTLFYTVSPYPASNPSYSYNSVIIPNLYSYTSFETGTATDAYGKMTFTDLNANSTIITSNKKWGSYALQMGNGYTIGMNSTNYGALSGNFTLAFWYRTPSTSNPPNFQMNFGIGGNTALLPVSQGTTPATMKFTSWGGYTVPSPAAVSLDTNFHHYTIVINSASSTCQFYMDGVLLINMPISNLASGAVGTYLSWYMYDNFFPQIDDIRMYSRCLTVSEALSLTTINPSGIINSAYTNVSIENLFCYWNFDSTVYCATSGITLTGTPTYNTSTYKFGTAALNKTSATLTGTISSFVPYTGVTISFWANNFTNALLTLNPAALTELNINTTNNTGSTIQVGLSGGTLPSAQYSSAVSYSSSNWYHIAVYIDLIQKVVKVYYNGTSILTYAGTDSYFAAASWTAPVLSFNKNGSANVDDLRIYSKLLTDVEINYLYSYTPTSIRSSIAPLSATLSTASSTETLVAIDSSGTFKNSAIPFSTLSELNNIAKTPIYHFKFEQNLNSSGSSSYGGASTGTLTYNASGKYGYCVQTSGSLALTSSLTGLNTSSGNSATICGWVNVNATSSEFRIRLGGAFNIYLMMYDGSGRSVTTFNNCFYLNEVTGYSTSYNFGLNNPDFSQSANINKWWFFSYTWDSANKTLGLYFSDGGANTYSTSKVYTAGDSTFTNALNTKFRDITTVNFSSVSSGIFVDNLKIYNTVLSSTELAGLATASTPDAVTPSVIFNTTTQTIYGAKTIDCNSGALALTNTTNDTTSTNKILTLNASTNKVTPCDKTYADVFKPQTLDIYDSGGVSYARLLISGGALSIQYYLNGVISGSPYALTVPIISPTPVLAWNFNTNLSSSYSTSGTYTFTGGSGSITSGGKFGSCWQNPSSASITADMVPFTRASGYSFTFSCWFKYNASSGGGTIRINFINNNQSRIWVLLSDNKLIYLDNNAGANAQDVFPKSTYNFPTFASGTNYEAWTYFAFSWNDSTSTLSFVMYVNGTKYSGSQVYSDSNVINNIRLSTRYNSSTNTSPSIDTSGCTNNVRFDDFRIWARALTDAEMVMIYNATSDT